MAGRSCILIFALCSVLIKIIEFVGRLRTQYFVHHSVNCKILEAATLACQLEPYFAVHPTCGILLQIFPIYFPVKHPLSLESIGCHTPTPDAAVFQSRSTRSAILRSSRVLSETTLTPSRFATSQSGVDPDRESPRKLTSVPDSELEPAPHPKSSTCIVVVFFCTGTMTASGLVTTVACGGRAQSSKDGPAASVSEIWTASSPRRQGMAAPTRPVMANEVDAMKNA